MRFAALIALAIVASTVPSLAAPAPYSSRRVTSKRHTASTDNDTVVDTSVRNGFVPPRIGTVILPGANLSLDYKRDTTSDIVQAIEAAFNELPPARKRDITADITAALQTLLKEGGSVLSDVNTKREADSILPVEERGLKIPKVSSTASNWLNDIGNVISLGVGANAIAGAFGSSNSTRRELDQRVDVGGALGGATLQFEDRSFTIPSSVSSILGKTAGIVSAGGTIATILSAFGGSSNITKRELGIDSERYGVYDQKRAVSSDIESILQQIIASFEGAADASGSTSTHTPTSTKRSTSDNDFLGLTDIITPEQLDELS
ncbi:hypothetical protein EV702DRAFT_727158 [Suillus placidus]|uniref:Uncharacterized protein n=1 Tax=Suillus placidus TaxID=48579 RepID=A0A9P7A2H8_9AGAM|nr:hypothetical protein EV702DRAFT_727158 [Suillus placidus]